MGRSIFEKLLEWGYRLLYYFAIFCFLFLIYKVIRSRSGRQAVEEAPVRSSGSFLVTVFIATAIVGILAAISVPNFKRARERANTRACYANQKTIAGAIEMYNLDKNTFRKDVGTRFLEALTASGYLQSPPSDPGQGAGSESNYRSCDHGNGITCVEHGPIQDPEK